MFKDTAFSLTDTNMAAPIPIRIMSVSVSDLSDVYNLYRSVMKHPQSLPSASIILGSYIGQANARLDVNNYFKLCTLQFI